MLVTEMGKFEDIVLYKKLRQGKIKLYTAIAAQDFFDKKKVNMDSLYFEENIIDETDNIIPKIQYYIRQIIAEDYITGDYFDEFYIKFTPLLFYRIDTIDDDPEKVVAETEYLDYYKYHVRLMVELVTIKDGVENYKLGENPIIATVDYEKFVRALNKIGYGVNYQSFFELARAILKYGKDEDKFPDVYSPVFENDDAKRYQKEAEQTNKSL